LDERIAPFLRCSSSGLILLRVEWGGVASDNPASQPLSCVSGRLSTIIIRALMNDHRFAYYLVRAESIGKKAHACVSLVGKQNGKIPGMIAVELVGGVPVSAGSLEWILGIPHGTVAIFMEMKAMGADGTLLAASRLIGRETGYFRTNPSSARHCVKENNALDLGSEGSSSYFGNGGGPV
jgi:hypothetical protein